MSGNSKPIDARHIARRPMGLGRRHVIDVWIGHNGAAVWLTCDNATDYVRSPTTVVYTSEAWSYSIEFDDPDGVYTMARALSDGREILLVEPRVDTSDGQNGLVLNYDGSLNRTLHLGDAIEDIQPSKNNTLWIGYFDEGVFSDHSKLANQGLVALDSSGELIAGAYDAGSDIADCYAFNVESDTRVAICPYTDFPVLQWKLGDRVDKIGDSPVEGSRAFAISEDKILFCGRYNKPGQLTLVDRESMTASWIGYAIDGFNFQSAQARRNKLWISDHIDVYEITLD